MTESAKPSVSEVGERRTPRQNARYEVLGACFDFLDYPTVLQEIDSWHRQGRRSYITLTNPHSVLTCHRDAEMLRATAGAGLTLPDGIGVIWAARLLGYPHRGRVTGPMLMLKLCDWGRHYSYRHFFYGGEPGVAARLAVRLADAFPGLQVAGTFSPPFRESVEDEDVQTLSLINSTAPDIVWIGLGTPKQEKWMAIHLGSIQATAMIGVGAAFDFHSGNVQWSPPWIRRLGLEWAWRTALEPARMWRRDLDNLNFGLKVARQSLGGRAARLVQRQTSSIRL